MTGIVRYDHHGTNVAVRVDLKGKHTEHCLCYVCEKFKLGDPEASCPIANLLYRLDVAFDLVTPVWECATFEEKEV